MSDDHIKPPQHLKKGKLYRFSTKALPSSVLVGGAPLYNDYRARKLVEMARVHNGDIVIFLEKDDSSAWTKVICGELVGWAILYPQQLREILHAEE